MFQPLKRLPTHTPDRRQLCSIPTLFFAIILGFAVDTASKSTILLAEEISPEELDFFENEIRPLLTEHCLECHSNTSAEANLRLDTRAGWQQGGDNGPPIIPGKAEQSRLVEAIRYENVALQMPPDGILSSNDIQKLIRWINMGAPDPRGDTLSEETAGSTEIDIQQRKQAHWAWQPVQHVEPPAVKNSSWPVDDLDRFILAKLEQAGLAPAQPADKDVWLRRASFDITGLAPTLDQLNDFLADDSAVAYERVVDRLLRSPHYGEHWGQHWLDLCRFAETRGHEQDYTIPEAYRFRDYVITAMNEDVPYNQFVVEHLAGDLVSPPRIHPVDRSNQSIQGTGFWHLHEATHSPVDIRGDEDDRVHNQIDVFSKTFLGLSLGCARCHDHKFDAIAMADYYAMFGYLQSSSFQLANVSDPAGQADVYRQLSELRVDYASKLKNASLALFREQLKHWPAYLQAAVSLARSDAGLRVAANVPQVAQGEIVASDNVVQLAKERNLDAALLARLAEHLRKAGAPDFDPFVALRNTPRTEQSTASLTSSPSLAHEVVEDFSSSDPERWITSGLRFGNQPAPLGDLVLGVTAVRPIERILSRPSAEADLISSKLTGFLRTPTFEITGDQLWYRYRGQADVFVNVDSHLIVAGPLHGVVKQSLSGDFQKWQWFAHNVRDYKGHRVHVEFTPKGRFAIDRIVFSDTTPPDAPDSGTEGADQPANLADSIDENVTTREIEQICQRLTEALDAWQSDSLTPDRIARLQWMLDHADLLPESSEHDMQRQDLFRAYWQRREEIEQHLPSPVYALAMLDGDAEDEPIHIRGNHRNRTPDLVPRAILTALGGPSQEQLIHGSGRLYLAQQLTDPTNPLVSRVMVNRVWYHLFGRGVVETVDDFGVMGKAPSHPELLDHLSERFISNGWSIKELIRTIVLSSTYSMSSHPAVSGDTTVNAELVDPDNILLHRMNVRRLRAESLRDHILAVSGQLNTKLYGPSVMVYIPTALRNLRSPSGNGPLDGDRRRSIYTEVRRNHMATFLTAFDKPTPFSAIGRRTQSNSPAQALILMNDPFVHQQAVHWANRLLQDTNLSADERLTQAYLLAYSRQPTQNERATLTAFLAAQTARYRGESHADPERAAWIDLCHTLMNVKEFFHVN